MHHSKAMQYDNIARMRRLGGTLGHAIRIVHGQPEFNDMSRRHIEEEHTTINSSESGSTLHYDANDPEAQKWVLLSLYKAGHWVIPRYTREWSVDTADAFYNGHVQFAAYFNPAIKMPDTRAAADEFVQETTSHPTFGCSTSSHEVMDMVLGRRSDSGRLVKLAGNIVRLIMEQNDPALAYKLDLELHERERSTAQKIDKFVQTVYPVIPAFLRRSAPSIHLKYFAIKQALTNSRIFSKAD